MHHGEFFSGDADTRAAEVPAASQPLTVSQGGLPPRGPVLSGESCGFDTLQGEGRGYPASETSASYTSEDSASLSGVSAYPCGTGGAASGHMVLLTEFVQ